MGLLLYLFGNHLEPASARFEAMNPCWSLGNAGKPFWKAGGGGKLLILLYMVLDDF